MKTFQWPLRALLFVCLVQIISCTKSVDKASNDSVSVESSDSLSFPVTNEFSNCKLRRIYQSYGPGLDVLNGLITYNGAGNPASVLFEPYYAEDSYFYYDRQGRLKEFQIFTQDDLHTKHFYSYDANNRIIRDSSVIDPEGMYEQIHVSTLYYDSQGRIVKENIKNVRNAPGMDNDNPLQRERNPTYTYDARGNLAVAGWKSSSYDNKVSIFRAHRIFQFVHRNYSRNNSSIQAKYNSKGLPLSVIPGNDLFFNMKNIDKAIYDCQ